MALGNHETVVIKHYKVDPVRLLVQRAGGMMRWGGISGISRLRFHDKDGYVGSYRILYHHGFAYSQATEGLHPAIKRWADQYEDWDMCIYSNDHKSHCTVLSKVKRNLGGGLADRNVIFVDTGTHQKTSKHGGTPDWSEIRGHKPVALHTALIHLKPVRGVGIRASVELGDV
jgi:hypothetical protein